VFQAPNPHSRARTSTNATTPPASRAPGHTNTGHAPANGGRHAHAGVAPLVLRGCRSAHCRRCHRRGALLSLFSLRFFSPSLTPSKSPQGSQGCGHTLTCLLFLYLFLPALLTACLSGREGLEGSTGGCQRCHESCPPRRRLGGYRDCLSLVSVYRNMPCVFYCPAPWSISNVSIHAGRYIYI
jgi:hypothetical protein